MIYRQILGVLVLGFMSCSCLYAGGFHEMAIWRYTDKGKQDESFGDGGAVRHRGAAEGVGGDEAKGVVVDSEDRILATGQSADPDDPTGSRTHMAIWCFKQDGMLFESFGKGGVVFDKSTVGSRGQDIVLDSLERILITGFSAAEVRQQLIVWRYNRDGTLDESFGDGGTVFQQGALPGHDTAKGISISIDSAGRILVTGSSGRVAARENDMALWRFNQDGTLDESFGSGGIVCKKAKGFGTGSSILTDSRDRILVAGSNSRDMALWRFNDDGTPDLSFGIAGVVLDHGASEKQGSDRGESIAMDSESRILVAGSSSIDMTVWRYGDDGSPDGRFGPGGFVIYKRSKDVDNPIFKDSGLDIVLDHDGRILVSGFRSFDMAIWRFTIDGALDESFGSGGIVIFNSVSGTDIGHSIALDSEGRILVAGSIDMVEE